MIKSQTQTMSMHQCHPSISKDALLKAGEETQNAELTEHVQGGISFKRPVGSP